MPDELGNERSASLPNAGDLKNFLDGADANEPIETNDDGLKDVDVGDDLRQDDPLPQGDTFDRKYVEKLRRENASYRDRAKKWESVFEGYEEGAVDEWKNMISTFKQDPKSVAEQWKGLSEQIMEQFSPAEQEVIQDALEDEDQPLTMSQLQNILNQREQEHELDSLVQDIEHEAKELGYNLKSREYKVLLMTAQDLPSGSIQEAHELLESEKQHEFDKRIAELEKAGGGPIRPSDKVGVASTENQIKDFKQAKEALSNFLDSNLK